MATFLGSMIIVLFCCVGMALGLFFTGKPLTGGCGNKVPGTPRCKACPNRHKKNGQVKVITGEPE